MIKLRVFLFCTLGFILFTIIGTISHEYGHILVAKSLGYESSLHYSSMDYEKPVVGNQSIEKSYFASEVQSDELLIAIGGPLQTILAGSLGLLIIILRKKQIEKVGLRLLDWLAVFLSLFWLRQIFNPLMSISMKMISPNGHYFTGDEKYISEILNWYPGSLSVLLGSIGAGIFAFILFKIIPARLRLSFIFGGLLGGTLGFFLWMDLLGPQILP